MNPVILHEQPRLPPFTVQAVIQSLSESIDRSIESTGIPAQWLKTKGKGIKVGVADTGCDLTHPDLQAAIKGARNFVRTSMSPNDDNGHGTHCIGTIAAQHNGTGLKGIAPEAEIYVAKVLDRVGSGSGQQIAAGVDWLVDQGCDIVSLSLGSPIDDPLIVASVRRAVNRGVIVVCAAGNDGRPNSINSPARLKESIAIGAYDIETGKVSPFSSRGPQVTCLAPGSNIVSTWLDGGYAKLNGTSMACPYAVGVIALALAVHRDLGDAVETPMKTPEQVREHLIAHSVDAGRTGFDSDYGWGLINPNSLLDVKVKPKPVEPPAPPTAAEPPVTIILREGIAVDGLLGDLVFVRK